jgi:hypothetical protein
MLTPKNKACDEGKDALLICGIIGTISKKTNGLMRKVATILKN